MRCDEKDRLLDEYAARAREFCEAVEQLRKTSNEVEAFIRALDETGRVHRRFTEKKRRANAFDLRYGETVMPEGPGWELCERVLARCDVIERLSEGW